MCRTRQPRQRQQDEQRQTPQRHARMILPAGFDEQAAAESPLQGWLSAHVELDNGCCYSVHFSDPVRL